jgi:hypothetical protein
VIGFVGVLDVSYGFLRLPGFVVLWVLDLRLVGGVDLWVFLMYRMGFLDSFGAFFLYCLNT